MDATAGLSEALGPSRHCTQAAWRSADPSGSHLTMTTSVVSGSAPCSARTASTGSTFARKDSWRPLACGQGGQRRAGWRAPRPLACPLACPRHPAAPRSQEKHTRHPPNNSPPTCAMACGSVLSAVCTNNGPSAEPPMPTDTTCVSGLPVTPTHSPLRTRSARAGSSWGQARKGQVTQAQHASRQAETNPSQPRGCSACRPPTHPRRP